jgi:hypothetical protein
MVPHSVVVGGYTTPLINISAEPAVTPKQRHMLENWWFASINVLDTSRYVILPYDSTVDMAMVDRFDRPIPTTLSRDEVEAMEPSIDSACDRYDRANPRLQMLRPRAMYRRQYVAVLNAKGEKEVWILFFRFTLGNDWKHHVILVDDGGLSFFQLRINLSTGKVGELVNGGFA